MCLAVKEQRWARIGPGLSLDEGKSNREDEELAKKIISSPLVSEIARRAAKLSVALLLTAAALAAATNHAAAQAVDPSIADSDGLVPIYSVCFGSDASE